MNESSYYKQETAEPVDGTMRVIVLAGDQEVATIGALLSAGAFDCMVVNEPGDLHGQLLARAFDVVVLGLHHDSDPTCEVIRKLQPNISMVVVASSASLADATRVMQAGAVDLLAGSISAEEIEHRVRIAGERSRESSERDRRADRIRGICRRIEDARRQVLAAIEEHGEAINYDPSNVNTDIEELDRINEIEMCSEFRTLVRQELDVEDLLRTSLEYMLLKTGPTNAAVFLAGGQSSFGLGAYVNYDLSRKQVEPMLQRLCDEACPAIAENNGILLFNDAVSFVQDCELEGEVPVNQQIVAVPCHHDGECLAILVLFRTDDQPFDESLAGILDSLRGILAEQLSTLIRIHNRLEPEWPEEPADDEPGFDDLAA
ncbi:MAG: hypothetical protein MK085_08190 [Phycisphaerales bacterium]|nr:hypothetical protein [Phycisphaerales bacterium]